MTLNFDECQLSYLSLLQNPPIVAFYRFLVKFLQTQFKPFFKHDYINYWTALKINMISVLKNRILRFLHISNFFCQIRTQWTTFLIFFLFIFWIRPQNSRFLLHKPITIIILFHHILRYGSPLSLHRLISVTTKPQK